MLDGLVTYLVGFDRLKLDRWPLHDTIIDTCLLALSYAYIKIQGYFKGRDHALVDEADKN